MRKVPGAGEVALSRRQLDKPLTKNAAAEIEAMLQAFRSSKHRVEVIVRNRGA